jgi:hypothetical protein
MVVEKMPEYEGGQKGMIADLVEGIVYPASAKQAGVQARVFVQFVINKEGVIQNPEILKVVAIDGGEITIDASIKDDLESASIDAVLGLKKMESRRAKRRACKS